MDRTNVFIISAPSGSGKSTLVERLLARVPALVFSISYTTRKPRGHEQNGKEYYFIERGDFERMISQDNLLEWARVFEMDYYGTARRFLDDARASGADLLLDIDVQGAAQIKQKLPGSISIFILPPSREEMERRLRRRGEDSDAVIERRVRSAGREINGYPKYDYVIINDDVDQAAAKLQAIVLAARWRKQHPGQAPDEQARGWIETAERCRTANAEPRIRPIVETFQKETASGSH